MKTVVLISGQMRTFAHCLPSLHFHVFRKLYDPVFFVSAANDADAKSAELLRAKYPLAKVEIEVVDQPTLPEPDMGYAAFAPYAITPTSTPGVGPLQGIMRQLWHLSRVWRFAEADVEDDDTVIRCRADLHFHRCDVRMTCVSYYAFTPWWGNYGAGVNDRFAVLGRKAAKAYFTTYEVLPELLKEGCPFHPESLVGYAMERAGIVINRTLDAEFAFMRRDDDGKLYHEHMQPLPGEMARYAALSR